MISSHLRVAFLLEHAMTVSSEQSKVSYTGNGSTTAFSVPFSYVAKSQIEVYVGDTLRVLDTHYTLTTPGATGTVNFITAPSDFTPANGVQVMIRRVVELTQSDDYAASAALNAE